MRNKTKRYVCVNKNGRFLVGRDKCGIKVGAFETAQIYTSYEEAKLATKRLPGASLGTGLMVVEIFDSENW